MCCVALAACYVTGVNDDAKRRLLAVAASYLQGAGGGLEEARLGM
jgi:hypothetical protein